MLCEQVSGGPGSGGVAPIAGSCPSDLESVPDRPWSHPRESKDLKSRPKCPAGGFALLSPSMGVTQHDVTVRSNVGNVSLIVTVNVSMSIDRP